LASRPTLQATTATALATKAELGKRILRAGVELTELGLLANVGKTGTLDEAKKLRDAAKERQKKEQDAAQKAELESDEAEHQAELDRLAAIAAE
jgi:hypothetical protein